MGEHGHAVQGRNEPIACHECDLLVSLPPMEEGTRALCPRCGYVLLTLHRDALNRMLAFSISAAVFLVVANLFPFLSLSAQGQRRGITLPESIQVLLLENETLLALLILTSIILIPGALLLALIYILAPIKHGFLAPKTVWLLRIITALAPWSMVEIFMIGMLVSLIKLASLADVGFGLSFWAYGLFTAFLTATLLHLDYFQVWQWVEERGS